MTESDHRAIKFRVCPTDQHAPDPEKARGAPRLYNPIKGAVKSEPFKARKCDFGEPRRIRTSDPLIRSQVLYPAELSVHFGTI